jgi:O-antigen/teichoic acid export membrane protein
VAYVRPAGTEGDAAEDAEQALTIYRANGNFRAVEVPAGRNVIRFKYSPGSVKFGLYLSFMSAVVVALALGLRLWQRHVHPNEGQSTAQRVTRNTIAPIGLNLINKVIDMVFAMLMLRILGPVQAGQYYLAIVVVGWFDIWTNFGLNTLATREVSRDRSLANRYLSNTILLRGLLLVGLLPSNISASFSADFNAWEKMEVPASVTTLTTLLKVFLGTVALLANTGFVGLAAVSIAVNIITMIVLYVLHRRQLYRPHYEHDWRFQREMLNVSWPLMVNLLLATLFFKVSVILLEWLLPDPRVLGWYSTAYKYIDAVGVVPAFFTMAIFPLMSRYAATAKDQLLKAYELAIKLLVMFAIPMGVLISALSTELVALLGGSQYLPQAADILRVMIWYMPFGFINSVTQYVLIALGQQRYLMRAFAIGLAFNVIANVVLITRVGFIASAWVAIASELALLIPFYIGVRRSLAPIPWVALLWKLAASAAPMVLLFWLLPGHWNLLAIPLGGALYLVLLYRLGALNAEERAIAAGALPIKRLRVSR